MNMKNQFLQIRAILLLRQKIWSKEVLLDFPNALNDYPDEWLQELAEYSHFDLWKLDARRPPEHKPKTPLGQYLSELHQLTSLPTKNYQPFLSLPSWAFSGVKEKKQHEISVLAQMLEQKKAETQHKTLVDIGGGVGHFARIMAHYFQHPTISVERDAELQALGKKRIHKHPTPAKAQALEFINLNFQDYRLQEKELAPLFQSDHFTLGLHTCGPLAVRHLEAQVHFKARGILNFGCCYAKMTNPKDFQLSQVSKENPIELSVYALNLATRSHGEMTYPDFCLKEKVKSFRYSLQLLLKEEFGINDFLSVGDSPLREYMGSFSNYAQKKIDALGLKSQKPSHSWQDFYQRFQTQQIVRKMFLADIIRWQYGRALELIILLDRALYLEENGHKVELAEYFQEKISPRNIGIYAYWA